MEWKTPSFPVSYLARSTLKDASATKISRNTLDERVFPFGRAFEEQKNRQLLQFSLLPQWILFTDVSFNKWEF